MPSLRRVRAASAVSAAATQSPSLSLLQIPAESRLLILKYLFADSRVTIGKRYHPNSKVVHQELELAILFTCKQVSIEGRSLIACSTRLFVYRKNYTTLDLATAPWLTYIPYVEHLTLSLRLDEVDACQYFDPRVLPNLKVLNIMNIPATSNDWLSDVVLRPDEWQDILRGFNDSLLLDERTA